MRLQIGLICLTCCLLSGAAEAQTRYAQPPEQMIENPPAYEPADSVIRLGVGPALRVSNAGTAGGLGATVDIGARAQGGRLAAAWTRVGSDGGLAQYTAELWVDFGAARRFRPIVGAGAGIGRLDEATANGGIFTSTLGLGVLRGTLEYVLPVSGADARVGLDVMGVLPAIRDSSAPDVRGWLITQARVGVGF
jgi:hypothetical protein